jgi:hypothetical protein
MGCEPLQLRDGMPLSFQPEGRWSFVKACGFWVVHFQCWNSGNPKNASNDIDNEEESLI